MPKVVKGKTGSNSKSDKNQNRPIHPYSRKAKKLGKQANHYRKVESAKNARVARLEMLAQKLRWFQNSIDDREVYTREDFIDLVSQYRNRFEDELEQIDIVHKVGKRQTQSRQHASREAAIRITKEDEKNQYDGSGMEVPDLTNKKYLEDFRKWEGELNLIQNLTLIYLTSHGVSSAVVVVGDVSENKSETVDDNDNGEMTDESTE